MNVSLTKELEQLVNDKVRSGLYHTASEVIRDGLRLLEERDRLYKLRLKELRGEIRKGLESGAPAPFHPKDLKRRVRKELAQRKKAG